MLVELELFNVPGSTGVTGLTDALKATDDDYSITIDAVTLKIKKKKVNKWVPEIQRYHISFPDASRSR